MIDDIETVEKLEDIDARFQIFDIDFFQASCELCVRVLIASRFKMIHRYAITVLCLPLIG